MALIWDLVGVAVAILLVLFFAWPPLKRGARSKGEIKERWKLLWTAGLISWVLGVVGAHYVGELRQKVEDQDMKLELMKGINRE